MTNITIYKLKGIHHRIIGFKIEGHSNYAPAGYDIICASISTITQAVIYTFNHILKIRCHIEKTELPMLKCIVNEDNIEVQDFLLMLENVLSEIYRQYPEYTNLTYKEEVKENGNN